MCLTLFLIQPIFRPNRYFKIYGRFRQQLRQKNTSGLDDVITGIEDVLQRNYRVNISKSIDKYITLKSRVEYVHIQRESKVDESGILFTQDVSFKPNLFRLMLLCGMHFSTPIVTTQGFTPMRIMPSMYFRFQLIIIKGAGLMFY